MRQGMTPERQDATASFGHSASPEALLHAAALRAVEHGGPDDGAPIRHDFSTNSSPLVPPSYVLRALAEADRSRYPDPSYSALRARLAQHHQVALARVLPTAGTSEAIRRLTLAALQRGRRQVWVPDPGYGDYRAAAEMLGLTVRGYVSGDALLDGLRQDGAPALVWLNEPNNPTGQTLPASFWRELVLLAEQQGAWLALDRAYEPLRLQGVDPVPADVLEHCWQCHSPNKSLGLTGVRAGVMIAPARLSAPLLTVVQALAPSWVLSAEGVALLEAQIHHSTQAWLADTRRTLAEWQARQREVLAEMGWAQRDSVTPFWLARPPVPAADLPRRLALLREAGIKLRHGASFGLHGWVRLSTQPPESQDALAQAWRALSLPATLRAANTRAGALDGLDTLDDLGGLVVDDEATDPTGDEGPDR